MQTRSDRPLRDPALRDPTPAAPAAQHRRYGKFSLEPAVVPRVETRHRRIVTPIPVPESVPVFEKLLRHEPPSMGGQPPILWDHAEGAAVFDRFGNRWIEKLVSRASERTHAGMNNGSKAANTPRSEVAQ